MLDPQFVRDNFELVVENTRRRGVDPEKIGLLGFPELAKQRAELLHNLEGKRATRNAQAKAGAAGDHEAARALKEEIVALEGELKGIEERYFTVLSWVPNIASDDTPVGKDESGNVEVRAWAPETGELTAEQLAKGAASQMPKKDGLKDHLTLGAELELIDTEQSAVVSGARFSYLKNELVILQNAIHQLLMKRLLDKGFKPMIPPLLVRESALFGTSHFPGDQDQVYAIEAEHVEEGNRLYLIGSAEPSLFAYYLDKTVAEAELPIKMFALTSCFRSEAGSWGKDVRGIKRVHQFDKLEMDVITTPETSAEVMEELLAINEQLLQDLKIPYRVILMCTGDQGYYATARKYDVEAWLPSQNEFMELMSDTNATDYQARRLKLRYRAADGTVKHPHTVNDTGAAMGRLLIAILEHWQQSDGSVLVPEVLQPYTFGLTAITR